MISHLLESLLARAWNILSMQPPSDSPHGLCLGCEVRDEATGISVRVPHEKRCEHIALLGRTGTGKSTLMRSFALQDIRERRGFLYIDLHGDSTPILLSAIAAEEQRLRTDLSGRLVVIDPSDAEYSVGMNFLEQKAGQEAFVEASEVVAILRRRWHLESLGARTDELLRNVLLALMEYERE